MNEEHRAGLLGQILAFIGDKPWKAVVVCLAGILGVVGYVLYQHQDEIIESWLTPATTELNVSEVPTALDTLVADTGADLVQIWIVDLSANSQRFIGARRSDGQRPVIPNPRRLPVIVATSDVVALVNVLAGHPACMDTDKGQAPILRRLIERGMTRACGMPIPPNAEAFVGIIYMAWIVPPEPNAESVALSAAREQANKLARR